MLVLTESKTKVWCAPTVCSWFENDAKNAGKLAGVVLGAGVNGANNPENSDYKYQYKRCK